MFVESLNKEDIFKVAQDALLHVFDEEKAKEFLSGCNFTKLENFVLLDGPSGFGEFVSISDFDMVVYCAVEPVQKIISNTYRRYMYRKFGAQYIKALDEYGRSPIEKEYQEKMSKHKEMIELVKRPRFAPFTDPKGIPYSEYLKNKKEELSPKFAPFLDPNGVPQEEIEK